MKAEKEKLRMPPRRWRKVERVMVEPWQRVRLLGPGRESCLCSEQTGPAQGSKVPTDRCGDTHSSHSTMEIQN